MPIEYEPIIIPVRITREFVTARKDLHFLYGQDYLQRGCLGQAWQIANEPNTWPIFTMIKYCSAKVFFSDDNYDLHKSYIDQCFDAIDLMRPIIPCPKIGMGCSRLFEICPKLFTYLHMRLDSIKYPNIVYKYS